MSGHGQQHSYSFQSRDEENFRQQHQPQQYQSHSQPPYRENDRYDAGPPPPAHTNHPSSHPNSSFARLQAQRHSYGVVPGNAGSQSPPSPGPNRSPPPSYPTGNWPMNNGGGSQERATHSNSPPAAAYNPRRESFTTPGQDNLGPRAAGGGITGVAMGVAGNNERESGMQAIRDIDNWGRSGHDGHAGAPHQRMSPGPVSPPEPHYYDDPRGQYHHSPELSPPVPRGGLQTNNSYTSTAPLAAAAFAPGTNGSANNSLRSLQLDSRPNSFYADSPYNRYSSSANNLPGMAHIDPTDIADDGDDGFGNARPPLGTSGNRRSLLGLHAHSRNASHERVAAGAAGLGGAAVGAAGVLKKNNPSGNYNAVPGGSGDMLQGGAAEKAALMAAEKKKRKWRWIGALAIIVVVVLAIVGGTVGGLLARKNVNNGSAGAGFADPAEDERVNGDLAADSDDIKALLNNENLHRVFPGIDYTPMNAQYPECIETPPSQNNVTRDVAILSQLTNAIRLYGTDCNQTQMVLHALDRLELTDVKVWLGVHLDSNETTNDRQLQQAWDILDEYEADRFKGVIVGNEVLFRKDLTELELAKILADVKAELDDRGVDLPLATADLGDNWTVQLASEVDIVMANIHPFFAGVTADKAADWTYTFWEGKDIPLTEGMVGKSHVISEVGWPSAGGNKCGVGEPCPDDEAGSVAGIDELNTFMDDFVCDSLDKGTQYFWFEALDEPWKVRFNTKDEQWEDKWGLLTADRVLKDGVKIPDCGGKTI